jgi:protein-tyrosine-phosphatase
MAEAFAMQIGNRHFESSSAGTSPSENLNETVVEAMLELNIDISAQKPKMITKEIVFESDILISMGCSPDQDCGVLFTPHEDWGLDDPHGQPLSAVRDIRDEILKKVLTLSRTLNS